MSIRRVVSYVVGKGCLLCPVCSRDKMLLAFALLHWLLLQVSLDFLLLHSNPVWWKGHHFFMLVLEVLECLHRNVQLQFVWHQWLGHRLGLLWCWMFCLGNKPRSFCHFWDCTAFWALADYAGYSISSKGFLPTTLYIMVIWVKFAHPTVHFSSLIPQMLKFTLAILFDHFQFTLICGPNIPGLYVILFFKYRT